MAAARPRTQLAVAVAAGVGALFGIQGVTVALPALGRELGVSDAQLGLFTAVYVLPAVVFAIPLGYLADALGRRRVFVAATLLFSLAGAAQALAGDFTAILGLRFLQGVGFAALMPLSVTLIGDAYRGAAQLRAQATRQVAMSIGEFVLPLAAAGLAALSWTAPLAAQGVLLPLALAGLLVLDDRGARPAPRGYAHQLGAVVRRPGMPAVLIAGFLRFVCKFALIAYLPLLLVGERGATLAQAALVLGVGAGVAAAFNVVVARLLRWVPASGLLSGAVVLLGGSLLGFAVAPSWEVALAVSVAYGAGDAVLVVLQNALVTEAAPAEVRAGAVAVSSASRNAGKLVAPLAIGALLLVVSVPLAFAAVALAMFAALPALRPLRGLDPLLAPGADEPPRRDQVVADEQPRVAGPV